MSKERVSRPKRQTILWKNKKKQIIKLFLYWRLLCKVLLLFVACFLGENVHAKPSTPLRYICTSGMSALVSFTVNDCAVVTLSAACTFQCFHLPQEGKVRPDSRSLFPLLPVLPFAFALALSSDGRISTVMSYYSQDFKFDCAILRKRRERKRTCLIFIRSCLIKLVRHSPIERMRARWKITNYKKEIQHLNKVIKLAYTIKCSVLRHKYRSLDINRSNCDALFDQLADDLPIAISIA